MIRSIEISNFRGIRQGRLDDLAPLTILVGANGSGKSTILDALLLGAGRMSHYLLRQAAFRRRGLREDSARWLLRGGGHGNGHARIVTSTENGERLVTLESVPDQPLPEITYEPRQELLGGDGICLIDASASSMEDLPKRYTQAKEQGRKQTAMQLVEQLLPELKDIEILAPGKQPVLYFDFGNRAIPMPLAGDGIVMLVSLAFELASLGGGVALLEEPEVHQHPRAIRQSARAIWTAVNRDIQVILTTHSLELIDALLAEGGEENLGRLAVYRTSLKDGTLGTVRIPGEEAAFARAKIEDDLR